MRNIKNTRRRFRPQAQKHDRLRPLLYGSFALLTLLPGLSAGFERDSHYYLRFGLSLSTCFNWDEAHLISSGDWGMDENGSTHAEMNPIQRRNKIDWHAFGHSDLRFRELWLRSVSEPDLDRRLIKLGQFMHFLEDWESHAGYGLRMGHARDSYRGRDPDSLGNSFPKNHRMLQSALDHLLATCEDLGRLTEDRDLRLIQIMTTLYADGLMDDLFEASDPGWKRGKTGCRDDCFTIIATNKERIEQLIVDLFKPLPEKNIPPDFAPGTELGIPESLAIPFSQDGEVIVSRSIRQEMRDWASASDRAPDVALSLEDVQIDYRNSGRLRSGWRLLIRTTNQGEIESAEGQIEIVVIDSDDETVLAQANEPMPVLQPGESREFRVSIAAVGRPEPDVIIAAFARVGDLTVMNDEDWLMLGDAEAETPDVPLITDLDPPPAGAETLHFLSPPRTFIVDDTVCLLVTAYTSGGDSPQKLDQVVWEVVGSTSEAYHFGPLVPGRWGAMSTQDGLVAGKNLECFQLRPETHEWLLTQDLQSLSLAVTLEAEGIDPYIEEFPLEPEFVLDVLELARLASEARDAEPIN
jgi:hypothetical protein